eukprot:scaffold222139_cov30-Tisochrysis_lutea.AAC.2
MQKEGRASHRYEGTDVGSNGPGLTPVRSRRFAPRARAYEVPARIRLDSGAEPRLRRAAAR